MQIISYDQKNNNKPQLVKIQENTFNVLFLDDCRPFGPFPSSIHYLAREFVANKMMSSVRTPVDHIYGSPVKCIGSDCYVIYFSMPECKDKQKVVSAINNADVIVCDRLSGNNISRLFAEAIARRVSNGFKNVIRYNSKGDLSNYTECFKKLPICLKELPPIVDHGQHDDQRIFELIKGMQLKKNEAQKK